MFRLPFSFLFIALLKPIEFSHENVENEIFFLYSFPFSYRFMFHVFLFRYGKQLIKENLGKAFPKRGISFTQIVAASAGETLTFNAEDTASFWEIGV